MGFKYDGLDRDSIRLLKPIRQKSKELSYEIVHVSLSSKPNYAALSYTWGLPGDTHHILLNGQVLPVRQNLHEALQQLQESKWVDKYLWVDAISINQGTNPDALQERSSQITLMKEIYEQAEKVLVWLGKPENENNNRLAFERIKYFKKIFMDSFKKGHPYRPWWYPKKPRTHGDDIADSLLTIFPAKDKKIYDVPGSDTYKAWLGIISLWKRPWWTRTWIFQEATVPENFKIFYIHGLGVLPHSSKVRFLCGDQKTQWLPLVATQVIATNILSTPDIDSKFLAGQAQFFEKLLRFRDQRIQHVQQPFLSILQMWRHTECSDPRDKVYAPLSVAAVDVRQWIRPDYGSKSSLEVYKDVVRYCLAQPGPNLDFLGFAKYEYETQMVATPQGSRDALPSWVPNFSTALELVPIPKVLHTMVPLKRQVGVDTSAIPNANGPTSIAYSPLGDSPSRSFIENQLLYVSGVFIDTIKDIIPNTGPDLELVRAVGREKGRQWATESNHKYPTGGTWVDAINRTLVLDVVYDYLGRPSERGGKNDNDFLRKPRTELSLTEYRYQMNMRVARTNANASRNLGLSWKGYMMLMPNTAKVGDAIWALSGGQVLYVLREVDRALRRFVFVGECYVHGLMDGEVVRMLHAGEARMKDISLV